MKRIPWNNEVRVDVISAAWTTEINMAWCNEDIPNEDDHGQTLRLQNEGKCLKKFHDGANRPFYKMNAFYNHGRY